MSHSPADRFFPPSQQARVRDGGRRYALVMEDDDGLVEEFFTSYVKESRLQSWGPPDTSDNPVAQVCAGLATPGHYSVAPRISGAAAGELQAVTSSLWVAKQHAEYLGYALGSVGVLIEDVPDVGLVYQVIPHHELWADPHPRAPRVPLVMRRLMRWDRAGKEHHVWAIWDIRDPQAPAYTWRLAGDGGEVGEDVTAEVVGAGPNGMGWSGSDYPWIGATGPYIPIVIHRQRDDGTLWAWRRGRNMARGSLMVMLLNTYAAKVARDGTGKVAMVTGMEPHGRHIEVDAQNRQSVRMEPGDVIYHEAQEGVQPFVTTIGGADDLPVLAEYARSRKTSIASDIGVTPSDAVRVGANPMSGVALSLTNGAKRDEQRRATPLCAEADLQTLRIICDLRRLSSEGLSISYTEIALSPDEERAQREQDEWDLAHGLVTRAELYVRRNPGATLDEARARIAEADADRARQQPMNP